MNKGKLITIEGIDGSGKSTLAINLAQSLTASGYDVVLTKEPGGSTLGKKLRTILQTQPVPITPIAEYLLFAADRAQHMQDRVQPALNRGAIVISDRMADSSLAYQGYGRGIDCNKIREINAWAMQNSTPDLVFYLKISPEQAAQRIENRSTLTAFEKEQIAFAKRVVHGFDEIFKVRQDVITIDATLSLKEITTIAQRIVHSWQPKKQHQQLQ